MINRISFLFSENTPPISNDVYKIALVHERSPHLTKREVQRKFFDGEISDKVLAFSYWKQSESLSSSYQFNDELKESGEMEQVIKLLLVTQHYHRPIHRKVEIFFQIFFFFCSVSIKLKEHRSITRHYFLRTLRPGSNP